MKLYRFIYETFDGGKFRSSRNFHNDRAAVAAACDTLDNIPDYRRVVIKEGARIVIDMTDPKNET
jgi:hypothetical protein